MLGWLLTAVVHRCLHHHVFVEIKKAPLENAENDTPKNDDHCQRVKLRFWTQKKKDIVLGEVFEILL